MRMYEARSAANQLTLTLTLTLTFGHENVRGALRRGHLGERRRHLLTVQVVAAALALR